MDWRAPDGPATTKVHKGCVQQIRSSVRTVAYAFWVRTGSRFAPSYANLVRTRAAACYQKLWFPVAGFHCGCQGFAVVSTSNLARPRPNPRRWVDWPARTIRAGIECRIQLTV